MIHLNNKIVPSGMIRLCAWLFLLVFSISCKSAYTQEQILYANTNWYQESVVKVECVQGLFKKQQAVLGPDTRHHNYTLDTEERLYAIYDPNNLLAQTKNNSQIELQCKIIHDPRNGIIYEIWPGKIGCP